MCKFENYYAATLEFDLKIASETKLFGSKMIMNLSESDVVLFIWGKCKNDVGKLKDRQIKAGRV